MTAIDEVSAGLSPASAGPGQEGQARVRPAIREPQFVRYLVGQSVSQLGNMVWYVALSWSAIRLGSPGTASVLMILSSLPTIAFTLLGGVIVDRFDVRRLMIGSDVLRTLITLAAAGLAMLHTSIAMLAVLALVFGLVNAVFQPAAGSMQPRLLQPGQYPDGATLTTVAGRLALSIGGPLGGLAVAYGGLSLGLLADAATFAVSVLTLYTVRPRPVPAAAVTAPHGNYLADFRAGCAFILRHPVLGPLCIAILLTELGFIGPMNIGLAVLSQQHGWGAHGIGFMLTGFGLGSAAGAVLTSRLRIRRNAGTWIAVSAALMGVALIGNGLAPSLPAAVAAAALIGLLGGPPNILGNVLIQAETPDDLRGRVSSFQTLLGLGMVPLAMLCTGFGVAAFGVRDTYTACAAVQAAVLLTLLSPAFRRAQIRRG
jgi:predicted MFS family arabinose efflux permease